MNVTLLLCLYEMGPYYYLCYENVFSSTAPYASMSQADSSQKLFSLDRAKWLLANKQRLVHCFRRIDLVLIPVMFTSYAFQYLDKACLTGAMLFGILIDLDFLKLYGIHVSFILAIATDLGAICPE
jgi:hypothetical protein